MRRAELSEETVLVDGLKVSCVVGGQGSMTVALPGWPSNFSADDRLLVSLARKFRVAGVNIPGFGRSEALHGKPEVGNLVRYIDAFVEAKGEQRVNLVGCSFGGMMALEYAAAFPEKVNKLVLIAPLLGYNFLTVKMQNVYRWLFFLRRFFPGTATLLSTLLKSNFLFNWLYFRLTGYHYEDGKSQDDFIKNKSDLRGINVDECLDMFALIKDLNVLSVCAKVQARTLILVGSKDSFFGEGPKVLGSVIKNSIVVREGAEHWQILKVFPREKLLAFLGD